MFQKPEIVRCQLEILELRRPRRSRTPLHRVPRIRASTIRCRAMWLLGPACLLLPKFASSRRRVRDARSRMGWSTSNRLRVAAASDTESESSVGGAERSQSLSARTAA